MSRPSLGLFRALEVYNGHHVWDLDLQKTVIGEGVQGRARRPLVTGLRWAISIVKPSDRANPGCM